MHENSGTEIIGILQIQFRPPQGHDWIGLKINFNKKEKYFAVLVTFLLVSSSVVRFCEEMRYYQEEIVS